MSDKNVSDPAVSFEAFLATRNELRQFCEQRDLKSAAQLAADLVTFRTDAAAAFKMDATGADTFIKGVVEELRAFGLLSSSEVEKLYVAQEPCVWGASDPKLFNI